MKFDFFFQQNSELAGLCIIPKGDIELFKGLKFYQGKFSIIQVFNLKSLEVKGGAVLLQITKKLEKLIFQESYKIKHIQHF